MLMQMDVVGSQHKSTWQDKQACWLACKEGGAMYYIAQQPSPVATARLKNAGYGREGGELAAHQVSGNSVTVTFVETGFFGGLTRHTMSGEEFKRNFAVIRNKRAKR